jgi:CRP-like cAMP-binding protein
MSMVNPGAVAHDIDSDFRRSLLQGIALFRGIDADSVGDLLPQCGRIDVKQGHVLLSPERENQCVYIVLSGRLTVHLGSLDAPKIADLGPGACAGEMSLIEDKDPSAFVVANEDSHLMVISHTLLWRMVDRSHTFCKNLLVVFWERLGAHNQ